MPERNPKALRASIARHAPSSCPTGPHVPHFDNHRGWLIYAFIPRTEDPQIIVEEILWQ
jgi:hypothetical protein